MNQRKSCYQHLSSLFRYPSRELLENLPITLGELSVALELPVPADLQPPPHLTELETAYTELFINRMGGTPAPPYGSVYLDQEAQLMGASTLEVNRFYQQEDLNLAASEEPPDFLATELEFLYYLINETEAAQKEDQQKRVAELWQKQSEFFCRLLHPWLGQFAQRLSTASDTPLYCWAANALERFHQRETTLLCQENKSSETVRLGQNHQPS